MRGHGGRASAHFLAVLGEGINQASGSSVGYHRSEVLLERRDVAQPEHVVAEVEKSYGISALAH